VAFEAGSFGTFHGAVAAQGERGRDAWNFSAQGGRTDNERRNNAFASANGTLRLDRKVSTRLQTGATLRWFGGDYGDPGDRYTDDPDNTTRESNLLATAFATYVPAAPWSVHTVLGGQDRRFVAESPRAGGPTAVTVVKNRRGVLDTQATFAGAERHRWTAGVTAEANHTRNTGFGAIDEKQTLVAAFVQDEWAVRDDLFVTAGLRNDDFDTFGRATTGRGTVAWLTAARRVKLRASYGTAFRSPSFLDLYGRSAFYRGNPDLRPERARGREAGADYYLPAGRGTIGLTWFDTRFRDLIAGTPDFRSVENIQRARTHGGEVAAKLALPGATSLQVRATYLEADNLTAGQRLLRRPRFGGGADLGRDFGRGGHLGAGVTWARQREDVNARTFARGDHEDFAVVRIYGSWPATDRLTLRARVENLLDETYEEVNGYPALGIGAYAGAEWRF
jgi:vitamin B12 transporter